MTETLFIGNPILHAWRVKADLRRWETFLVEAAGIAPHALLRFAKETQAGLTSFIAELRVDKDHQLLRPYQYELLRADEAVSNRETETFGLEGVHQRDAATAIGTRKIHDHFRSQGDGAQAVRMSPINEVVGQPEYKYTAVYFLTHNRGTVNGWQLFVDFSQSERLAFMAWVSRRAGADYHAAGDLELAATPVVSPASRSLYSSVEDFIADTAGFLKSVRDRVSISGISLENPEKFIADQMRLEAKNRQEAENWVEPYVRAIAQGSIDLGRRIITKLQLKVLNLTESTVRAAARLAAVDFSALQVFLRACGFLSFTFSPEISAVSSQSIVAVSAIDGVCREKICGACGAKAGDMDTECPKCHWRPG